MSSSTRRLIETRRVLSGGRRRQYDRAWADLRDAVAEAGAHAWRFRSAADPQLHIEYLEFGAGNDPRSVPGIDERLRDLEDIAPGIMEEWIDAPPTSEENERD